MNSKYIKKTKHFLEQSEPNSVVLTKNRFSVLEVEDEESENIEHPLKEIPEPRIKKKKYYCADSHG